MVVGRVDLSVWTADPRSEEGAMIVSRLPPSRILGSVASTIHTPGFKCFISTARILFISSQWETVIFDGDPASGKQFSARIRLAYTKGYPPCTIHELHDELAEKFNELGNSGMSLMDAAEIAVRTISPSLDNVSVPAKWR
jgi:hypothetical protein